MRREVRVRVRGRYGFEPLMTTGIEIRVRVRVRVEVGVRRRGMGTSRSDGIAASTARESYWLKDLIRSQHTSDAPRDNTYAQVVLYRDESQG